MVAQGHRAVMVYLIQRADAETFSIAGDLDPGYAEAFKLPRRLASRRWPTAAA